MLEPRSSSPDDFRNAIRQAEPQDLDPLYAISLATGFEGGDASRLYTDPRLIGHIYSAPYATLEPRLSLVAEDSQGIVGFAVGTLDTVEWEERLERQWWPRLRQRYPDPPFASRDGWTADQRRAHMIHHPQRTPPSVSSAYPAHVHINLLPRGQGSGLGSRLLDQWSRIVSGHGVNAIHVGANRANTRALGFWQKLGFVELTVPGLADGRTIWLGRIA